MTRIYSFQKCLIGVPLVVIYPALDGKQRPAFGVIKGSGDILGDIVISALPETVWEVLQ